MAKAKPETIEQDEEQALLDQLNQAKAQAVELKRRADETQAVLDIEAWTRKSSMVQFLTKQLEDVRREKAAKQKEEDTKAARAETRKAAGTFNALSLALCESLTRTRRSTKGLVRMHQLHERVGFDLESHALVIIEENEEFRLVIGSIDQLRELVG